MSRNLNRFAAGVRCTHPVLAVPGVPVVLAALAVLAALPAPACDEGKTPPLIPPDSAYCLVTEEGFSRTISPWLVHPLSGLTQHTFDADGRLSSSLTESESGMLETTYTYDATGFLIGALRSDPEDPTVGWEWTHQYDTEGLRTSTVEHTLRDTGLWVQTGEVAYAYDSLGRLTTATRDACNEQGCEPESRRIYAYDAMGRVSRITLESPWAGDWDALEYTEFDYDAQERLIRYSWVGDLLGVGEGKGTDVTYNRSGHIATETVTYWNDYLEQTTTYAYAYDSTGRILTRVVATDHNGEEAESVDFSYNAAEERCVYPQDFAPGPDNWFDFRIYGSRFGTR